MQLARALRVQVASGRSSRRALSFWSSGESKSNDPVSARLPGISKKDEDYYDLWMRGDPYRLWSESLGHRMATGLPSWSDVWGIVTKQQAVDPDLMPKMAAYLDVYGYKLHGRAVEQVDPHQTLDEVLGGAQHVAAAVTDAISTLQRHDAAVVQAANQKAAAAVTSDSDNSDARAEASTPSPLSSPTAAMTAAEAGSEVKMPSASEVAQARELLALTMGPRLREAFFRSDSSSSSVSPGAAIDSNTDKKDEAVLASNSGDSAATASSLLLTPQAAICMPLCPQGLAPEAFGVSVTSVRVVVAARTPLQRLHDLVPTATSSNAAFAPQLTDAFHLGLFPDQSEEGGGGALVCLREVATGLYSSAFPVTPAFLSDLRRELDQNGVDGEGGSVDDGFLSLSFGCKGGFMPMGGSSSSSSNALSKGKGNGASASGGGMAGEVSGTELAAFLTSRGLTFPIPKDREAFVSLLVDVHLYAHHRTEPPPSTTATVADDTKTAAAASAANDDKTWTSDESARTPSFPPAAASTESPSEPISDAEWARVEALIKKPDADAKAEVGNKPITPSKEEPPQTPQEKATKQTSKSTGASGDGKQMLGFSDLLAFLNDSGDKSSESSGDAATKQEGPRSPASIAQEEGGAEKGGLWQSTWTLGMRVDPRPGRRWDYEWHVADLDGAPLGLATRSIGASQTSETVLEAASASMPDGQSSNSTKDKEAAEIAAAAAAAAAQEAERAWAALSAAPYLMDDEEEKPGAFFPSALKKKGEAQQPPSSSDAAMEAASAAAGEEVEAKGEAKESEEAKSKEDETAVEPKDLPLGKTGRSKEI